jgi:cytoskeletal protein RodZ
LLFAYQQQHCDVSICRYLPISKISVMIAFVLVVAILTATTLCAPAPATEENSDSSIDANEESTTNSDSDSKSTTDSTTGQDDSNSTESSQRDSNSTDSSQSDSNSADPAQGDSNPEDPGSNPEPPADIGPGRDSIPNAQGRVLM